MSTMPAKPDYAAIKQRQQAVWAAGDYAVIGTTLQIVGERLCEAVHRERSIHFRKRGLHDLTDRPVEQGRLGQRACHERAFDEPAHRLSVVEHRDLAHAVGAHQVERLPERRRWSNAHQCRRVRRPPLEQLLDRVQGLSDARASSRARARDGMFRGRSPYSHPLA